MSRILLTWELGLNFGHLARLLPIATRLKEREHAVLIAARDLSVAARVLGPAAITFVQAPFLIEGHPVPHRPAGYSDILRAYGWGDQQTLWGLVQGWLNLFRMFRPDCLVLDYSPTAGLAARIAGIRCVQIGNGFELPPSTDPLPPFPGFSWAKPGPAAESEHLVLAQANAVTHSTGGPRLEALKDLFPEDAVLRATFPELDHYHVRRDGRYIGPLLGSLRTVRVEWPIGRNRRVFACVRPDTEKTEAILAALAASNASVVCCAPGFTPARLTAFQSPHIRFSAAPVDLSLLLPTANACLTYGAEGTIAASLFAGVPQLLAPHHVEAFMAARRIEDLGVGLVLRGSQKAEQVLVEIDGLLTESQFAHAAQEFRKRHRGLDPNRSADDALPYIETASPSPSDSGLRACE